MATSTSVIRNSEVHHIIFAEWANLIPFLDGADGWVFRGQSVFKEDHLQTSLERAAKFLKIEDTLGLERRILREFKRRAFLSGEQNLPENSDLIQWLALLQHHGAPTRLLDFTNSVYVALFFAVERAQTDSEIWCVRAAALSRQLQTPWSDNKNTALQLLLEPKPGAEAQIAPCAVFKDEPFYPSHNLIHGPIKDQSFNQVIPTRQSVRLSSTRVLDTPTSHLKYFFKVPMAMTRTFTLSQMTENPAAKVTTLKIAEMNRRPFTHDELKAILRVASTEWRGMILTGLYTGQRLKDIALLTWANLDMERQEIRINTSKTDRRQVLPVAAPLLAYFAELPAGDVPTAPLFPAAHPHGLRANGTAALSTQFHQILAAAGLVVARAADHASKGKGRNAARERSPISFHALRHTATSWLKEAGVTEAVAMDIIGHESKAISTHYTHVGAADKRKAVALLPDITK